MQKIKQKINDNEIKANVVANVVPFVVHEAAMTRAERYNRRMCIALIIAIILIFITNG